jgi:Mrp family chromosome partitioning ATPase
MKGLLPLRGRRLGIFGKGGSGKSTLAVLLARGLNARGYEVCILDIVERLETTGA